MSWDNDGENNDGKNGSSKGSKGPWGSGTKGNGIKKGPRPVEDPSKDSRGPKDNVPQNPWGRREGPSSSGGNNIDDFIDLIQDRVRKIISGGGSNGGQKGGGPKGGGFKGGAPKGSWGFAVLLATGAILIWLSTGLYRVQEGEIGVVKRFGEMVRYANPGLQYHLPAPFEAVIVKKVSSLNIIDGGMKSEKNGDSADATLILTGDENMVHTNYTVSWKIKDIKEYLFTARNPECCTGSDRSNNSTFGFNGRAWPN
jgi:membrane protease subunit HflK